MSVFVCPCCKVQTEIFPSLTGGAKGMCQELNVRFLEGLPLDPKVARCCDEGKDFITELPDSPVVDVLSKVVKNLLEVCQGS